MAAPIEAKLRISAEDRTAKVFNSIEARLRRAQRVSEEMNRKQAMIDKANRHQATVAGLGRLGGLAVGVVGGMGAAASINNYAALERQMTRVGIAAGASAEETENATKQVARYAYDLALPLDQAYTALDSLVATGMNMPDAMAFLPSILKTAQATGAATDDMSASANALATSFKVASAEMQNAFDVLVVGGQLGQFELRDMAQYLPSLTASASKLGYEGLEGTKRLVAMLQTVRQVSGDSSEAATATRDAMEKTLSPTVAANFKKYGVNVGQVLEDAAKRGENGFEAVMDVLRDMTSGMSDTQRNILISSIYTDSEARRAVTAMINLRDKYRGYMDAVNDAAGATENNLKPVLNNMQATLDRTATSWTNLTNAMVRAFDAAGGSRLLAGVASVINNELDRLDNPELAAKYQSDNEFTVRNSQGMARQNSNILAAESAIRDAETNRDTGIFPYVPGEVEKAQAELEKTYRQRAEYEAGLHWAARDRGFPVAPPDWLNRTSPWPVNGAPEAAPQRIHPQPQPNPRRRIPLPQAHPLRPVVSIPAAAAPAMLDAMPAPGTISLPADAYGPGGANALRDAMDEGGTTAASAILDAVRQGAQMLERAGAMIEESLQSGARALATTKVQMETPPSARVRPPVNVNPGRSMPDAGMPGAR